ncbi:MAG: alpha/beta hydrolase, partial [Sandaracinaceae bacterium]|nr:alpha/beta hydrolase [Sandaracinaceae bacterium]
IGAYLAARLAAVLGDRVLRVVLLSGLASLPPSAVQQYLESADALERGELELGSLRQAAFETVATPSLGPAGRERLRAMLEAWPLARVVRSMRRVAGIGERPATQRLAMPATIVHARDDRSVPLELGRALAELADDGTFVELAEGGHGLAMTEPERVARLAYR